MQKQVLTSSYSVKIKKLIEEKEYELALSIIEEALVLPLQRERNKMQLLFLQSKIEALMGLFRFEECLKELEVFNFLLKEEGAWDSELQNYYFNKKGAVYYEESSYDKALKEYERALQFQKEVVDIPTISIVQTLLGIGLVYNRSLKSQKKAIYFLEQALSLAEEEGFSKFLPEIYNGLAMSYDIQSDLEKAIDYHQLSIEADIAVNGEPTMAMLYVCLSQTYFVKMDNGKATSYLHKALEVVKNRGAKQQDSAAEVYIFLAKKYISEGKIEEGIQYCQQAFDICIQLFGELHESVAYILGVWGGAYFRLKKFAKALEYLQKGVSIHIALLGENHSQTGIFYYEIGMCLLYQKSIEEALTYFLKALRIFKENPYIHKNQNGIAHSYIGQCYLKKGDYDTALIYFQKSLVDFVEKYENTNVYSFPLFSDCDANSELLQTFVNKAEAFFEKYKLQNQDLKDLKAAKDAYTYSFFVVDLMRREYNSDRSHFFLNRAISELYQMNMDVHKELYCQTKEISYLKACFSLSEGQKAHLLQIAMKEEEAKTRGNVPLPLLKKEHLLRAKITALKDSILRLQSQLLSMEKDKEELILLNGQCFDLELQYENLIQELEREYPEYYEWKHKNDAISVEEIQAYLLQKNTRFVGKNASKKLVNHLLVSYFVGKTQIYIFELTAMEYKMHEVAKPTNFEQLIEDFNTSINRVEIEDYIEVGTELYKLLVEPLQLQQKQRTQTPSLIILRDDVLNYLSFDALFFPITNKGFEAAMVDFHDLDYMVYHFDIAYHYSGILLLNGEKKQEETQKQEASFLGFAPVNFGGEGNYSDLAMETHRGRSKVFRGAKIYDEMLGDLPNTAIEVNEVYQLFHQQKLAAKAYLFGAASKENLFAEASKHKYVLIATHGFQYDESGSLSGIYLAKEENDCEWNEKPEIENEESALKMRSGKPKESTQEEEQITAPKQSNDILTTAESYLLSLEADLVVLSSCRSGIGRLQSGEGLMALHRGFLYAGASNIVFTQFDIPDEMSSILVKKLFEFILQGNSYIHSLRKAKMHILQKEGVSPQDWAGFALIGY